MIRLSTLNAFYYLPLPTYFHCGLLQDENQSRLLHEFLCRCPELVPVSKEENESPYSPSLYQIIGILFSGNLPVFDYIISLMPVRCFPSTISKILSCLLESHNNTCVPPSFVSSFPARTFHIAVFYLLGSTESYISLS